LPAPSSGSATVLRVRLTPRGGRDRIDGWSDDDRGRVLRVRVSAPPVDGKANAALVKLVAKSLGVAKSAVTITAGETARIKTLAIDGDAGALRARIAALA